MLKTRFFPNIFPDDLNPLKTQIINKLTLRIRLRKLLK